MDKQYAGTIWNVSINGKKLELQNKLCISSIDLEENSDGSDTLTLGIQDPEFTYIEDDLYIKDVPISFDLQLVDDPNIIKFDGYISSIDISFPEDGSPTLSVYGIDRGSHLMNRKKKKRSWDDVTSADVVQKIAKEYGLKCDVEPGYAFKKEDTITQSDQTDIEFVEDLADKERDPFMAKVVGDTLVYRKLGMLSNPVETFMYRVFPFDIVSFNPQINKETIKEEIEESDINSDTKTTETSVASKSQTSLDKQGDTVENSSDPTSGSGSSGSGWTVWDGQKWVKDG